MSEALKKVLTEERQRIYAEIKGITDAAAGEKRDLSADESARFDKGSADMDSLAARVAQLDAVERANKEAEESLVRNLGAENARGSGGQAGQSDRREELRKFLLGEGREFTVSPTGVPLDWTGKRAAPGPGVTGTAAFAGDLIGRSMHTQIVEHMVQTSGVLQAGPTILNTTGGESLDIPTTTSWGTALKVAENGALLADGMTNPAVAKRTLTAYKYGQIIQVSKELVQDSAFDIESFVAKAAGINVGLVLGTALVTGDGSGDPSGIVTGASTGKTGAAAVAGVPTADDLIDLYFSVIGPYRNNPSCAWIVKDATLASIRKLKETGTGAYLFQPAVTVGAPDSLYGKPIFTDPNVAATGVGAKSVVFGDISAYYVRYAGPVRFERSDEYGFGNDLVSFKVVVRADGVLVDQTGAVKVFVGGAAS